MASKKVVAVGDTKDEVDEVTDIKFESEDDDDGNGMLPRHSSEILDSATDEERELLLKQALLSKSDISEDGLTQKRNKNLKIRNATDSGNGNVAGLIPECRVTIHRVDEESGLSYVETLLQYISIGNVFCNHWAWLLCMDCWSFSKRGPVFMLFVLTGCDSLCIGQIP